MASDDPWSEKIEETLKGKTFWIKPSTIDKFKEVRAAAKNPEAVMDRIRKAIEREVDEMHEQRNIGRQASHP